MDVIEERGIVAGPIIVTSDGEFIASATTEYFTRRYATTNKMPLDFPGLKRPG